jgi:hypothetical protein
MGTGLPKDCRIIAKVWPTARVFREERAPAVDVRVAIGDVAAGNRLGVGVMVRIGTAAILVAFAGTFSVSATPGGAQTAPLAVQTAQVSQPVVPDLSERGVRRPKTRLRIFPRYIPEPDGVYPRYYPGPNAVRECNAVYVPESRPGGAVIVPHMSCYWRRG